jgi:O-acetyl-ADP-ribose deacetylase (regulator of RNase III)
MPAPRIVIISGDLVEQEVDAIVNAANSELVLGGGVAGAIRARGGPAIQQECDAHGPVRVGEAAITGGGELPASHVIHAASMSLGGITTSHALRSSMQHAFRLAREKRVRTIAIPAVGTGIARFPIDECAVIMARCLRDALTSGWAPEEVRFVLFGEAAKRAFEGPFVAFFQAPFDPAS